jgi:hypothetical protein
VLHTPPLRFHCVGGCWDRTQESCDYGIGCQRRSNHSARSHPQRYSDWTGNNIADSYSDSTEQKAEIPSAPADLFHVDGIPAVDESVERDDGNLLGALVVAEGAHAVSLLARLLQQRPHVLEGRRLCLRHLGEDKSLLRIVNALLQIRDPVLFDPCMGPDPGSG